MTRRGPGLGGRLLLFSLVLLAIPWLGYRYIEEMKEFLINGQEQAQLLTARGVATVLHGRSDLFDPSDVPGDRGLEQNALYVYPLENSLQVDGYASDWGSLLDRRKTYARESILHVRDPEQAPSLSFGLVLGERDGQIYGFLRVSDVRRVYRHPQYRRLDNSDHVRLTLVDAEARIKRLVLLSEGEGTISAYEVQEDWKYPATGEPLFQLYGVWREQADGYDLEFRIPSDWFGPQQRLLLSVVDVDNEDERSIESVVATLPKQWSGVLNRLIVRSPELENILHGLAQSDAGICVIDRYLRVRAVLGGQDTGGTLCADTDRISQELVKDALAGQPNVLRRTGAEDGDGELLIVAAHPIYSDEQVIGAVLLEKNSEAILKLQRNALNQAVLATLLVLLLVVAGLLLFGTWLALRIRRLQRETAAAIDSDGRVLTGALRSDLAAQDELGDLSRGISGLLGRLQRYTGFLESVPRTLRHEILNPVNTISMSLQKLQEEQGGDADHALVKTARQATRQLERIVHSLTEAAHIEDALKEDVVEVFDLASLVKEYVDNSMQLHPAHCLKYCGPDSGVPVSGSDLRVAQLLDKLKDNALDFSTADTAILFEVSSNDGQAQLSVANEGPEIPAGILEALFVGMASSRPGTAGKPHLGIGLFIAQRIAQHHGGHVVVVNRQDAQGVRVSVNLPLSADRIHRGDQRGL